MNETCSGVLAGNVPKTVTLGIVAGLTPSPIDVHVFGPGPLAPAVSAMTGDTASVIAANATTVRTPTCIRLIDFPYN
jgi:hypothetical protein